MFHVNKEQTAVSEEESSRTEPFLVQYTSEADTQLSSLVYEISTAVQAKLSVVAAVDPYIHGHADPLMGQRDRRVVVIADVRVTFWISDEVRVLTVMRIQQDGNETTWPTPNPGPPACAQPPDFGPFGEPDEDDDEVVQVRPLKSGVG